MGLSNEKPRDSLTSIQVALDMAQAFKALLSKPDLEALAKAAYALPEREQRLAEEATSKISEYKGLIAEQCKRQDKIDAAESDLDERERKLKEALAKIDDSNLALDKRQKQLDQATDDQKQTARDLSNKLNVIMSGQTALDQRKAELDGRETAIETYEASLKEKAAQMQGLIQGL